MASVSGRVRGCARIRTGGRYQCEANEPGRSKVETHECYGALGGGCFFATLMAIDPATVTTSYSPAALIMRCAAHGSSRTVATGAQPRQRRPRQGCRRRPRSLAPPSADQSPGPRGRRRLDQRPRGSPRGVRRAAPDRAKKARAIGRRWRRNCDLRWDAPSTGGYENLRGPALRKHPGSGITPQVHQRAITGTVINHSEEPPPGGSAHDDACKRPRVQRVMPPARRRWTDHLRGNPPLPRRNQSEFAPRC